MPFGLQISPSYQYFDTRPDFGQWGGISNNAAHCKRRAPAKKRKNRLSPTFVICARAATTHIAMQRDRQLCVCVVSRCKSRSFFLLVFLCFSTKTRRSRIIHPSHHPIKPIIIVFCIIMVCFGVCQPTGKAR